MAFNPDASLQERFDHHIAQSKTWGRALALTCRWNEPEDYDVLRYRRNFHARMAVWIRQRMRIEAEPARRVA